MLQRDDPMRIIISAYVRFPNALAWHALEVCRGLHAAGHHVLLLCQRDSPLASWSQGQLFPVNCDLNLNRLHPRDVARGISELRRTFREFQPDILNPHCPPGHTYFALVRSLEKSEAPLIRTVAEPRPPKRNLLNRRLHEKMTDGVILTTESSHWRYSRIFTLNRAPVRTILPGFRADDFTRNVTKRGYREQLGLRNGQVLAGIVARMSPEKGQEVLLAAMQLLSPADRDRLHCVIAGQDSRERTRLDLQQLAKSLGVQKHVTFLDPLDDVRPLLAELDLGIITSNRSEAVCRIALEYMSFGIPIVASNVNILPEVVRDGINGWIFPNHDAAALAARLREILYDEDERTRRGQKGYALVRDDFSSKHEIEQIVAMYQTARRLKAIPG